MPSFMDAPLIPQTAYSKSHGIEKGNVRSMLTTTLLCAMLRRCLLFVFDRKWTLRSLWP
ncbi:hypothetical protein CHELA20_11290 [Hyphomicrobiales bacterium]|nr:hypothetical protein CHELA20_11290 [Hyphomicrobiales bacterium]CAH1695556.1 hypothetical protein CHELA41_51538 [Hyphomicrobiales bacterium]